MFERPHDPIRVLARVDPAIAIATRSCDETCFWRIRGQTAARRSRPVSFWRVFVGLLRLGRSGCADRMGPAVFGSNFSRWFPL